MRIYILKTQNRSSAYGIGSYIKELIKNKSMIGVEFTVITLYSNERMVSLKSNTEYNEINIPTCSKLTSEIDINRYYRNSVYLLCDIIPTSNETTHFHINFLPNSSLINYLKSHFNCKIILTIHSTSGGFILSGNYNSLAKLLANKNNLKNKYDISTYYLVNKEIELFKKCDKLIFISNHSYQFYKKYLNEIKTHLIPHGISDKYKKLSDNMKESIKQKYNIDQKYKLIIYAGRIDKGKGVEYLINAFKIVINKYPNIHLIIAGDGDYNLILKQTKKIWFNVTFTGYISQTELHKLYQISDLGVIPSMYEELGLVAIEMMMHKKPLIVTDTTGLSDIITNNYNGIKIPKRKHSNKINIHILAEKIYQILSNEKISLYLSQNTRKTYLKKYTNSIFSKNMNIIYKDTIQIDNNSID